MLTLLTSRGVLLEYSEATLPLELDLLGPPNWAPILTQLILKLLIGETLLLLGPIHRVALFPADSEHNHIVDDLVEQEAVGLPQVRQERGNGAASRGQLSLVMLKRGRILPKTAQITRYERPGWSPQLEV